MSTEIRMRALAVAMLFAGAALPAAAQTEPGDPRAGLRLSATWCANCHQVAPGGPGPSTDAAPTFRSIAQMASTTSMSLRAYLQTPHPSMPDYRLTREELDDVVAYLLTLKR
ncbi:c-type cytochrome [Neoroseomonas soli]|uniref:Cytochrome c n=1 Tax=Neoroseomonas soli TaxID=1081025 RepID=A0A9X9X3G0_9PROT|nr:cytochrome c [Neoroseomonas soli]MBR0673939.1 cytochrome c [Neoroseomonas soli]